MQTPTPLKLGMLFLKFLEEPYGIIPIGQNKRPMVKVKGHPENIVRLSSTEYNPIWETASYYGVVASPRFNPDVKKQLLIIDVDVPSDEGHDNDGREHLDKLSIPPTLTVQTKSGGLHFYLWAPMGVNINSRPYPGIDVVYTSPFFACGPDKESYKVIEKHGIADITKELHSQLMQPTRDETTEPGSDLLDKIKDGVPKGERHDTLLRLMGRCVALHIPLQESMIIGMYALSKCDQSDGLPTLEEIEAQWRDASAKFHPDREFEGLLRDNVLVRQTGRIARITDPGVQISKDTLVAEYPESIPNFNRPINAQGMHPFAKMGNVWLDCPDKIVVDDIGYYPLDERIYEYEGRSYLNEYVAPTIVVPTNYETKVVRSFEDVFKQTYGPIYGDFLKIVYYKWLYPHVKFNWALYLTSVYEGTGKGLSFRVIQSLFGARNCNSVKAAAFDERFNAAWTKSVFTLVDEANMSASRMQRIQLMNALKRVLTEDLMTIEKKGQEKETAIRAFFMMFIFSNQKNTLDVNEMSRRFLVYHDEEAVSSTQKQRMHDIGDWCATPEMAANLIPWMRDTVDITVNEEFAPRGEARKTEHLLDQTHLFSDVAKVISHDIVAANSIFHCDIVSDDMLRMYAMNKLDMKNAQYIKTVTELLDRHIIKKLSKPYRVPILDKSLVRNDLPLSQCVSSIQSSETMYCVRNHLKWCGDTPRLASEVNKELDKVFQKQSGTTLRAVGTRSE